jgi:hypothetical protein
MNHLQKHFSASLIALAALLSTASMGALAAATAPSLGSAASFAALSNTALTCTGAAVVGDIGSLTAVTGFPPALLCTITGGTVTPVSVAQTAWNDLFVGTSSTNSLLAAQACDFNHTATEQLSGQTLSSGVHCFPSDALLNGPLPLNLVGSGPWILRMGTQLTTGGTQAAPASVLVNGKANCGSGVFWQIGSATIGAYTAMVGDILAYTSIGFTGPNSSLVGGAFANTAAVTMTGPTVTISNVNCGAGGGGKGDGDGNDEDKDHHDKDKDHKGDKDKDHKDDSRPSFKDFNLFEHDGNKDEHGDNR